MRAYVGRLQEARVAFGSDARPLRPGPGDQAPGVGAGGSGRVREAPWNPETSVECRAGEPIEHPIGGIRHAAGAAPDPPMTRLARRSLTLSLFLAVAGATACHQPTDQGSNTTQRIKTVFVIVMENHNWADIVGNPSAPYINAILSAHGGPRRGLLRQPRLRAPQRAQLHLDGGGVEPGNHGRRRSRGAPSDHHGSSGDAAGERGPGLAVLSGGHARHGCPVEHGALRGEAQPHGLLHRRQRRPALTVHRAVYRNTFAPTPSSPRTWRTSMSPPTTSSSPTSATTCTTSADAAGGPGLPR